MLICDNDNVAPYGSNLGVGGTPGYMAPEVILGQAKPGMDTDLFSLAVILFELFFLSHPLEGANCCKHPCLTPQIERQLMLRTLYSYVARKIQAMRQSVAHAPI